MRVLWIAAVIACSGRPPPAQPAAAPAVVADAGPPADAAPLDQDLPRLAERSLAMYQDIVSAFAASGEDCAAAVTRLHELTGRYRDVTVANAKVLQDGRAKELKAALAPHSAEFDAAAAAVVRSPVVARCAQDPRFSQAFDELLAPP
ncbi:MAG: hypothetical protein E6J90_22295 [Deltaproteobacteria bacterium]|nr:MAG: hypothetical protein E6J91_37625 [Deltaproteobacteria bacterium]TMQ17493.1 MAG: hypothetical protein E6J90_22295 [Deltaproteobacteria bacterium]